MKAVFEIIKKKKKVNYLHMHTFMENGYIVYKAQKFSMILYNVWYLYTRLVQKKTRKLFSTIICFFHLYNAT